MNRNSQLIAGSLCFHSLEQHNGDQAYYRQKRTSKTFQKSLTLHAKLATFVCFVLPR